MFFGSSDPGGANVIAAVLRRLPEGAQYRLFTDRHGYRVTSVENRYEVVDDPADIADEIERDRPDVVFTATSLASGVERTMISAARRRGIPCAAVIDHWTNFARRFVDESGAALFPDAVFVPDETALQIAIAEGVPPQLLRVFGHPHFVDARSYVPPGTRNSFWRGVGVRTERPVIVFLSDSLTETAGGAAEAVREFGYTEMDTLERVLTALGEAQNASLVIRPHPKERQEKFAAFRADPRVSVLADAPLWDLLGHADHVIGMFSSALVEAAALGKRALRVEIGAGDRNLLPVPRQMFFDRVTEADRLAPVLQAYLARPSCEQPEPAFSNAFLTVIPQWLS